MTDPSGKPMGGRARKNELVFRHSAALIWAMGLLLGTQACKKAEAPGVLPKPVVSAPRSDAVKQSIAQHPGFKDLPADKQAYLLAWEKEAPFEEAEDAKDRREMIRPAPPGFKPEDVRRKFKLTVIPRKTIIRKDESFWYALELQNVGLDPLTLRESGDGAYLKAGDIFNGLHWGFTITKPNGKEVHDEAPFEDWICPGDKGFTTPGWDRMSEEQKFEAAKAYGRRERLKRRLNVTLAPGEILTARPWRHVDSDEGCARVLRGEEAAPPISGRFRELWTIYLREPGTYRLKLVFNDQPFGPPKPPDEEEIQRMIKRGVSRASQMRMYKELNQDLIGRIEANTVAVEVVP